MILISEVGPRDGLQSTDRIMSLEAKEAWIMAEAEADVREIEVGSFVPPSLIPQLADTAEVVAYAKTLPGLNVVALVPNAKGTQRAAEAGVHGMSIPYSISEMHSMKNVRKSHSEMVEEIRSVAAIAKDASIHFAVGLSTAFGYTMEGPVSEDTVVRLAEKAAEAGAQEISLSHTTGYANPVQVKRLLQKVRAAVGPDKMTTLHLHNTRGLGLANALAGLEEGITTLDASLGGIGGCPFALIGKPEELFDDPHLTASGGLEHVTLDTGATTRLPILPIMMGGAHPSSDARLPLAGENAREVLSTLGYATDEIESLFANGPVEAAR